MDLQKPVLQARNGKIGIYVHYPYCYQKCDYCDFYSEGIGKDPSTNEGLLFETFRKEFLERKKNSPSISNLEVDTIFFGGGTPSKASSQNWKELLSFFRDEVKVSTRVEISLEANPEDLSAELLDDLASAGINRLNVGVQTRNEKGLAFLGRHIDTAKYNSLSELFKNSPIPRLGIDLMYGIPNLTKTDFEADLDFFLSLNLEHLSLYSLTLEKGTAYSRKVTENLLPPPNEEIQREILEFLPQKMESHGYIWYEVSNYAKPGQFSRHNLRYWMYEPYIGIGPGAHGFLDDYRYGNARNASSYLKRPNAAKQELASPKEELILSLFRLFLPFAPISFFQKYLNNQDQTAILRQIEVLKGKSLCLWDGYTFQWNESALLMLDDLILTLATAD